MSSPARRTRRKAAARRGGDRGDARFRELAAGLAQTGRNFYARGWALGTSGNFSAVVTAEPLRLAITSTGLDKSALAAAQFLEIDERARVVRGEGRPCPRTTCARSSISRNCAAASALLSRPVEVIARRIGFAVTTALKFPLVPSAQPRA